MSNTNKTVWALDPHTKGKHDVLEAYLDAWYPILMQSSHKRLVFIDAFAGPGEYVGGEPGSPAIAIDALCGRRDSAELSRSAGVTFLFIEKRKDRAAHLRDIVLPRLEGSLPDGSTASVKEGTFDDWMREILDYLDAQKARLAPSFVMIDPFGYSDYPMKLVREILSNKSAEVFITFMGSSINRWAQETPDAVTRTFGTAEWKDALGDDATSESVRPERQRRLISLYEEQLRMAGAKYVLPFDVYKTAKEYVYTLFFATNNLKGCEKMKDAMWKVAPSGDYRFVGKNASQISMSAISDDFVGSSELGYSELSADLIREFGCDNWVDVDNADRFMASDRTGFRTSHLRSKALKPMESEGRLIVERPSGVNKGAFTPKKGIRIMFPGTPTRLF